MDKKKSQTQGYMDILAGNKDKPKKNIPMCWKCVSKITRPKGDNSFELIGCVEESKICNYSDAEKMCPLTHKPKRVLIFIAGGCVRVDHKPDDVEIEIRDYDVEGEWDEDNVSCKLDDDGDRYQEMIFPAEEKKSEITFQASGDQAFPAKDEEEENPEKYLNYYKCPCSCKWESSWSCMCDDRCPDCNTPIQPYKSEEIDTGEVTEHHDPDVD